MNVNNPGIAEDEAGGDNLISDFGMGISDFVFGQLPFQRRGPDRATHQTQNPKSAFRKSEIVGTR